MTWRFHRGQLWHYAAGRYRPLATHDVQAQVRRFVTGELDRVDARDRQRYRRQTTSHLVNNVIGELESLTLVLAEDLPVGLGEMQGQADYVAMANGLLHLPTLLSTGAGGLLQRPLREHTPSWFTPVCLPYGFDPAARCPRFEAFVAEMFDGDADVIALVQELFGYVLTPDISLHKFFVFFGEGANGKSVLLAVLRQLVGPENVSAVGPAAFGSTFGLQPTLYKLVNICAEADEGFPNEGKLKAYVVGDPITIDRKYRDPVTVTPTARLVFATNNVPHFRDTSGGMKRRAVLIPCPVVIPPERQDPRLIHALVPELPGIFNWAVEGQRRLQQQGWFTEPAACRHALDTHLADSNPVRRFVEEKCVVESDAVTPTTELYAAYSGYCQWSGERPVADSRFGRELRRVVPGLRREREPVGDRRWLHRGIRLASEGATQGRG